MGKNTKKKIKKLKAILKRLKSVVVAYSGGVDSTFLLAMALRILGKDKILAVTAVSELFPQRELNDAKNIARRLGVKHIIIKTSELKNKKFAKNPVNRCYYCKRELFSKLKKIAGQKNKNYVIDGTNFDDLKDLRFGRKAAEELGILSPLLEAGLNKNDIRNMSKKIGLSTWNKGTFACLASRLPHNQVIKKEDLKKIEKLEDFLRQLDFRQIRVRLHDDVVRIEVGSDEIERIVGTNIRAKVVEEFKKYFPHVALDLTGYRTGSMNETLRTIRY